jgi:CheY-like chemotaxis protein
MTESGPASAHARKTVLIVDDDQGTLHVLKNGIGTILDMFDVLTASNGREAIEHMEDRHVDALVTDLAMPVMDGFALIAYVTNLKRALPLVVLSGLASSDIGERLAPYGGLHVLSKPASYQDVAEALLQAMEHVALGHVEGIPLAGVLQLVESERRSCTVVVTSGRRKGRLSFQSGRLIDAFSEDFGADGEAAAYDILGWDDTSIAFEHLPTTSVARSTRRCN